MAGCNHDVSFDGASKAYKRALVGVIAINGAMAAIELSAGIAAQSVALQADALDFIGDTATYAISLLVIGAPLVMRARVALLKGVSLALMALMVLGASLNFALMGSAPEAPVMTGIGVLALAANLASVLILMRWRDGDANVRSVWLCSRNDAIGNVAVMAAGGLVFWTGSNAPDLIVAVLMAGLFLRSAVEIITRALDERRHALSHSH